MEASQVLNAILDLPPRARTEVFVRLKALLPPLPTKSEQLFPRLTYSVECLASHLDVAKTSNDDYDLCVFAAALEMLADEVRTVLEAKKKAGA